MVLYYNPKNNEKNNNISGMCKFLVSKCQRNEIKYIFYCPENNLFYDSEKNQISPKTNYKLLDDNSNLDYIIKLSLIIDNFDVPKYELIRKKYLNNAEQINDKNEGYELFKSNLKNTYIK